jgi:hypothetical protein
MKKKLSKEEIHSINTKIFNKEIKLSLSKKYLKTFKNEKTIGEREIECILFPDEIYPRGKEYLMVVSVIVKKQNYVDIEWLDYKSKKKIGFYK